ncbi:MAG: hypothetical protein IGS39_18820 [Calothrix sp. C42_A2020_038]|nr:hypothetical protein [Calothrix sp. C42_A2020_038]
MSEFYRDLLTVLCIGLLAWGVIRVERIYQYPFFMGSIFVSFILPQVFSLFNKPGPVTNDALEKLLLMSCLCAVACWIGYEMKPNKKWISKLNIVIDERKLFQAGIALMAQGWFFNFLISRTDIQTSATNGNWTGPATIYLFFSQVINIAFAIFFLQTLKRPSITNIIFTIISSLPILSIVFVGRRQVTMTLIIIIGLSLYLVRRYIPPRWIVIAALLSITFLIPLFGELRGGFWNLVFSGDWQELISLAQKAFNSQQKGDILELRNAALLIDAVSQTNKYGLGTGWWDAIIFQYVPGQIVGYDLKESLQFKVLNFDLLSSLYEYQIPTGTTITGVGDSFIEFGYLGSFCFFIIGYMFKNLWISSFYMKSTISRLLYMGLVSSAMLALTHGVGRFFQEAIFQIFFVSLVAYYAQVKYKPYSSQLIDS